MEMKLSRFLIAEGIKKKFDLQIDYAPGRKGDYEKKSWILVGQRPPK